MATGMVVAFISCAWAISVSPPRTEVRVPPGGKTTIVMTVTNTHDEPYDVEVSEKPWFIYPDNKAIRVEAWLELPRRKKFRLKAGKSREVKLTIHCPKEAVGELMGMASFTYQGLKPGMITPMISTAIYLEVEGTEKNTGEIVSLGAGTRNGQFQVGARVKATGNIRVRPTGSILLVDDKGQGMGDYFVPEGSPIFPGATLDCAARGPGTPPLNGHYILSATIRSGTLVMRKEQKIRVKLNGDVELENSEVEKSTETKEGLKS